MEDRIKVCQCGRETIDIGDRHSECKYCKVIMGPPGPEFVRLPKDAPIFKMVIKDGKVVAIPLSAAR